MTTPTEDILEHSITTLASVSAPPPLPPEKKWDCFPDFCARQLQFCASLLVAVIVAVVWVAGSHLAQNTYSPGQFEAPFLVMFFSASWLILFYPLYIVFMHIHYKGDYSMRQEFRESVLIYKPYDFRVGHFIGKSFLFCGLWTAAQFTYIRALDPKLLDATDVSSLYATNFSFVYMLSWVVLFEKFIALRIVAMIFSITGIVLFVYADGFGSSSMWGVVLAVCSSSSIAIFKVLFKKFIGDVSYGQLSLFLTIIGLCNLLCLWPVTLILYFTGSETITASVPWSFLCGSATVLFVFHFLTHYAERVTFDFVMGLGMIIGIPICAVSDYIWKNREFHGMKISAVVIITFALILLLIPDRYPDLLCKLCTKCLQEDAQPQPHDRRHRIRGVNPKM